MMLILSYLRAYKLKFYHIILIINYYVCKFLLRHSF